MRAFYQKKKAGKKVATGTNTHVVSSPCDVLLVPPPPPSNKISAYTLFVSALHVKSFLISTFTYGDLYDGGAFNILLSRFSGTGSSELLAAPFPDDSPSAVVFATSVGVLKPEGDMYPAL